MKPLSLAITVFIETKYYTTVFSMLKNYSSLARPTFSVLFKSIDTLSSYAVSDTSVLSLFKIASTFKCRISGQLLLMTCVLATGCIQRSRSVSLIVKNYFISTICVSGTSFKKYYLYYHNFKSFKSYSNINLL